MRIKSSRILKFLNIILPIIIILGEALLFFRNYMYNNRERVCSLSETQQGADYVFDGVTLRITTRGGDSGAWLADEMASDSGDILFTSAVGTIYELEVINGSTEILTDWTARIEIPEDMWVNNTWNGGVEYHQNVLGGSEAVQTIDLADYSEYDIALEHSMTGVGPMIRLYKGDSFVYYPDPDMNEMPIQPSKGGAGKESSVKIGFIMYIADRPIDYTADFSSAQICYHLKRSIFSDPLFWMMCVLAVVWVSCLLSMIIIKINLKRFVEQQKRDAKALEQTMQTFVNFIEAKDPSTMGHSLRVAKYSKMLAGKLGYPEEECHRIYCIALMHDCGKIYIPDDILTKPGRLTDEEYEIMKKHTVYGSEILRDFTAIEDIGTGALSHHERYDGKGYPNGLAGENIPMIARIICVSDAFDAMNSRRCYRDNLSRDAIISELENNRGKQFDPRITDCLLSLIESSEIDIG